MKDELILEEFLPYRLSITSHTVSTNIARIYEKRFGVSIPEWRVIAILGRFPGLSAVEVAERTMMDKVAVSRAVTKLIKAGRIDREFADADRRRAPGGRRVSTRVIRRGGTSLRGGACDRRRARQRLLLADLLRRVLALQVPLPQEREEVALAHFSIADCRIRRGRIVVGINHSAARV